MGGERATASERMGRGGLRSKPTSCTCREEAERRAVRGAKARSGAREEAALPVPPWHCPLRKQGDRTGTCPDERECSR